MRHSKPRTGDSKCGNKAVLADNFVTVESSARGSVGAFEATVEAKGKCDDFVRNLEAS